MILQEKPHHIADEASQLSSGCQGTDKHFCMPALANTGYAACSQVVHAPTMQSAEVTH